MIKIRDLKKSFKQGEQKNIIIKKLNLEIETGEFISVIGRSGSGKTTFLNMLAGLINFDDGEIKFGEENYSDKTSDELTAFRGQNISFVFQQFHLVPNLTVRENIELPLDINKIKARFSVREILKKVGLSKKENSYPFELSGGEQQRVAIARAFIGETKLLLADEPTGNLDIENANNIMEILRDLHKETKNTVVLISHDIEMEKYSDKVYEIKNKFFNKLEN